jgi:hypothetical protein
VRIIFAFVFIVAVSASEASAQPAGAQPDVAACAARPARGCALALALAAARSAADGLPRALVVRRIMEAQLAIDPGTDPRELLGMIGRPDFREAASIDAIDRLARADRIADAERIAAGLSIDLRRTAVLRIAAAHAAAGRDAAAAAAIAALTASDEPSDRAAALVAIGRDAEAREVARQVEDASERDGVLALIAEQQAELRRRDVALATARAIADEGQRSLTLAQLAETLDDPGWPRKPWRSPPARPTPTWLRRNPPSARALASAGRTAEAVAAAQATADPLSRAIALAMVARITGDQSAIAATRRALAAMTQGREVVQRDLAIALASRRRIARRGRACASDQGAVRARRRTRRHRRGTGAGGTRGRSDAAGAEHPRPAARAGLDPRRDRAVAAGIGRRGARPFRGKLLDGNWRGS